MIHIYNRLAELITDQYYAANRLPVIEGAYFDTIIYLWSERILVYSGTINNIPILKTGPTIGSVIFDLWDKLTEDEKKNLVEETLNRTRILCNCGAELNPDYPKCEDCNEV